MWSTFPASSSLKRIAQSIDNENLFDEDWSVEDRDEEEDIETKRSPVPYFLKTKLNDSVQTPRLLYADLDREFRFDDDPCPYDPQPLVDGLKRPWGKSTYVNPPFSNIAPWVIKAIEEKKRGKVVVMLITARVSARYWFDYVFPYANEIRFLEGKVKFENHAGPGLPQPIAIVIFDGRRNRESAHAHRRRLGQAGGYRYYSV